MRDSVDRVPSTAVAAEQNVTSLTAERRAWLPATRILFASIAFVALILRLAALPHPHEIRDSDEIGYTSSGLVLLEGMSPGYKFTPAGPLIWTAWWYATAKSAAALLFPSETTK